MLDLSGPNTGSAWQASGWESCCLHIKLDAIAVSGGFTIKDSAHPTLPSAMLIHIFAFVA